MSKRLITNLNRLIKHPRAGGRLNSALGSGGIDGARGIALGLPASTETTLTPVDSFWLLSVNPSTLWSGVKQWEPVALSESVYSSGVIGDAFGYYTSLAVKGGIPHFCDIVDGTGPTELITRVRNHASVFLTIDDNVTGAEAINAVAFSGSVALVLVCFRDARRPVIRRFDPTTLPWTYLDEFTMSLAPEAAEAAIGTANFMSANSQMVIASIWPVVGDSDWVYLYTVTGAMVSQLPVQAGYVTGTFSTLKTVGLCWWDDTTKTALVMEYNALGQLVVSAPLNFPSADDVMVAASAGRLAVSIDATAGAASDLVSFFERAEVLSGGVVTSVSYGALLESQSPDHAAGSRHFCLTAGS